MKNARKKNKFPPGWDEKKARGVMEHYENRTEDEAAEEDEFRTQTPLGRRHVRSTRTGSCGAVPDRIEQGISDRTFDFAWSRPVTEGGAGGLEC